MTPFKKAQILVLMVLTGCLYCQNINAQANKPLKNGPDKENPYGIHIRFQDESCDSLKGYTLTYIIISHDIGAVDSVTVTIGSDNKVIDELHTHLIASPIPRTITFPASNGEEYKLYFHVFRKGKLAYKYVRPCYCYPSFNNKPFDSMLLIYKTRRIEVDSLVKKSGRKLNTEYQYKSDAISHSLWLAEPEIIEGLWKGGYTESQIVDVLGKPIEIYQTIPDTSGDKYLIGYSKSVTNYTGSKTIKLNSDLGIDDRWLKYTKWNSGRSEVIYYIRIHKGNAIGCRREGYLLLEN